MSFNQSTYRTNENDGLVRIELVSSNPSSNDITIEVFATAVSATGRWLVASYIAHFVTIMLTF